MFLKSLEITGFKSFARHTRLELPNGITALVGPNGSGKSNIVDAVRWCLGEQSMRDLRSQRAEDIIHAGPRRVLGAAEVTLTLQDSEATHDAPWREMSVARRLYRSGESEYLLNRRKSRLRDVVGTLHDIGIDASRHVIVTQGMADSLLAASPTDRRALLEQAAGLAPYRDRRDDAKQKLDVIARNIATVEIILAEIEPRLRLLRRQVRAVRDRDEAVNHLRARTMDWYGIQWSRLIAECSNLKADTVVWAQRRKTAHERVHVLEEEVQQMLDAEQIWNQKLQTAVAALHLSERDRDAVSHEVKRLRELQTATFHRREELNRRVQQLEPRIEETQARVTERDAIAANLGVEHSNCEAVLKDAGRRSQLFEEQRRVTDRDVRDFQKRLDSVRREHAKHVDMKESLGESIERHQEATVQIERRLVFLADEIKQIDSECDRLQTTCREMQGLARGAEGAVKKAREAVQQREHEAGRAESLSRKAHALASEVDTRTENAGSILRELERSAGGGILNELEVPSGWETALAAALDRWGMAQEEHGSSLRAAPGQDFLTWRAQLSMTAGDGCLWADQVVKTRGADPRIVLSGTIFVESDTAGGRLWDRIEDLPAFQIGSPPVQIVSRSGRVWSAVGVRQSEPDDAGARYLHSRASYESLVRRKAVVGRRARVVDDARLEADRRVGIAEREYRSAQVTMRSIAEQIADVAATLDRLRRSRSNLDQEKAQRLTVLTAHQSALEDISPRLEQLSVLTRETTGETAILVAGIEDAQNRMRRIREQLESSRHDETQASRRLESVRSRQAVLDRENKSFEADLTRWREELASASRDQQRLRAEEDELAAKLLLLEKNLAEAEANCLAQMKNVDTLRNTYRPPVAGGEALRLARDSLTDAITNHEMRLASLARATSERDALQAEIETELTLDPDDLPKEIEHPPTAEEMRRLRSRAGQYADAGSNVEEEVRDLEARQQSLQTQVRDLTLASQNLLEIMVCADREMHARFGTSFQAVNEEFSRVFRVMLRGGHAHLEQIDDEGGIEVRAQLPGRRSRSSSAFSGGERALIASSLLFGVLCIKPTPFCILDEVDAALDETNVDRYLAVVRDLSRHTQMIVVTHNRATMAAADALYGLTMDDDGVSSVLSLQLDAYATTSMS